MPDITLKKSASNPSTPPADYLRVFVDSSGVWQVMDESGTVTPLGAGYTQEQIEDLIGAMLDDSASVDWTYNDETSKISAVVLPAGIAHQDLSGAGTNTHAQIDTHITTAAAHIANTSNPHSVTAAQAGADPTGSAAAAQAYAIQRANHTGTQAASTISDFDAEVRNCDLTGLSLATSTDVTAADSLLVALGKLQAQLDSLSGGAAFDPATTFEIYDDWVSSSTSSSHGWADASTGTNAFTGIGDPGTYVDGNHPGIMQLYTGTTTTGAAILQLGNIGMILGGGVMQYQALVNIHTVSDGTNRYTLYIGAGDSYNSTEHTNGVYFVYSDNLNSGNWIGKTASNGSRTTVNTSIPVTAGWHTLKYVVNAAGTSVEFFVDGVSGGTSSTNIPAASARWHSIIFKSLKSLGTTARYTLVDYVWLKQTFTTPRS